MIKVECFMFDVGFFLLVALQKLEIKVALPNRSTPMIKSRGQKKTYPDWLQRVGKGFF